MKIRIIVFLFITKFNLNYGQVLPIGSITGFNQDIIANGIGPASQSTTIGLDEINSKALVSLDFKSKSDSPNTIYGLPVNGKIPSSITSGVIYQLADYNEKNALYLTPKYNYQYSANQTETGTLEFEVSNAHSLRILWASSAGRGNISSVFFTVEVNFDDGTVQKIEKNLARDSYYSMAGSFSYKGTGTVNTKDDNLEGNSEKPRLFETAIAISSENQSKKITGITFTFLGNSASKSEYSKEVRLAILSVAALGGESIKDVVSLSTVNAVDPFIKQDNGSLSLVAFVNGISTVDKVDFKIIDGASRASINSSGKITAGLNGTVTVRATLKTDVNIYADIIINISGQLEQLEYCSVYFTDSKTCSDLYINNVSTNGAVADLSNLGTGCAAAKGYNDFTNLNFTAEKDSKITMNVDFSGKNSNNVFLSAWIDWNGDKEFTDDEKIYASQSTEKDNKAVFEIDIDKNKAIIGNARMRLKAVYSFAGDGACSNNSQGEVEDYEISIVEKKLATDHFTKANYSIYPNPTSGLVRIESSVPVKEVIVFNMAGEQVLKRNSAEINLSKLIEGVYIFHILFENGTAAIQKIVKN